jgi:CheY-like chemotaxis protein
VAAPGNLPAAEGRPATERPVNGQAPRQGLHVLLAEDNAINQRLVVRLLQKQGHEVAVVNNGLAVLAALQEKSFDVVLLDVQMPELGGFEVTARLREQERGTGRHLPIIALTAHALKGDRERCLAAGMDGYVSKPVKGQQLLRAIADVLRGVAPVVPEREALLARLDGDENLLRELAGMFLEDYPRLLEETHAALTASDASRLERTAHKLQGAVRNFSRGPAVEAAQQLETLAREGRLTEAEGTYRELVEALEQLRPAVEALTAAPV